MCSDLLSWCPNLERLELGVKWATSNGFRLSIPSIGSGLANIRQLSLYYLRSLDDAALFTLGSHCSNLESITLFSCGYHGSSVTVGDGSELTREGFCYLLAMRGAKLTAVAFPFTSVVDDTVMQAIAACAKDTTLLDVTGCWIEDPGLIAVLDNCIKYVGHLLPLSLTFHAD